MCKQGDTVVMNLKGVPRTADIDTCLAPIIGALNNAGATTVACCCGHGLVGFGNIVLADGRELIISPSREFSRKVEIAFGGRRAVDMSMDHAVRQVEIECIVQDQLIEYGSRG